MKGLKKSKLREGWRYEMIHKLDKYTKRTVAEFATIRAAAEDAGVSYQSLHKHLRMRQLYPGRWYYRRDMTEDEMAAESFEKNNNRPLSVEMAGFRHAVPSARWLADALCESFYKVRNGIATGTMKSEKGIIHISYWEGK